MKYSHIVGGVVAILLVVVAGGETGFIPYKFTLPIIGVSVLVAGYYYFDIGEDLNLGGKNSGLAVDPNDALTWLQEEHIPSTPGHRMLNLDKSADENMKLHTRIQKVNENGEEKVKFGVVGRPLDQNDAESIAYVVHCDEGWAEYSGELHTAEDRLDPFNGKHVWMRNAGYKARVEEEGKGGYGDGPNFIYQGRNVSQRRGEE